MKTRTILLGVAGALLVSAAVVAPIVLAPGEAVFGAAAPAIADAEHAATIAAMRPPKRERPVIAIAAWNAGTEVSDFLSAYAVLKSADIAEVTVVAEHDAPVQPWLE